MEARSFSPDRSRVLLTKARLSVAHSMPRFDTEHDDADRRALLSFQDCDYGTCRAECRNSSDASLSIACWHAAGERIQGRLGKAAGECQGSGQRGIRRCGSAGRAGTGGRLQPDQRRAAGAPATNHRQDGQNWRAHHAGAPAVARDRGQHTPAYLITGKTSGASKHPFRDFARSAGPLQHAA